MSDLKARLEQQARSASYSGETARMALAAMARMALKAAYFEALVVARKRNVFEVMAELLA